MTDMLVKLYDLPDVYQSLKQLSEYDIDLRVAHPLEKEKLLSFIDRQFSNAWSHECERAFDTKPVTCFIALHQDAIIGFACYDCTCKNFFGPMGVSENHRKKGVGRALLLKALDTMHSNGYGYAIIGGIGPEDFYAKCAGAARIKNSTPGIYKTLHNPR